MRVFGVLQDRQLPVAVELRLGEKSACQTQDLIDLLELPFSRSSSLMRRASAVLTPSRCPVSRSCRRIQLHSVCVVQPILGAMA